LEASFLERKDDRPAFPLKIIQKIEKVLLACFEDHPNTQVAKSQMRDFGGH